MFKISTRKWKWWYFNFVVIFNIVINSGNTRKHRFWMKLYLVLKDSSAGPTRITYKTWGSNRNFDAIYICRERNSNEFYHQRRSSTYWVRLWVVGKWGNDKFVRTKFCMTFLQGFIRLPTVFTMVCWWILIRTKYPHSYMDGTAD